MIVRLSTYGLVPLLGSSGGGGAPSIIEGFSLCRKFGFTLAEVLITLGIIGIVAAMTIPSLIASYREKVYIEKVAVAYNLFLNATTKMIYDEGVTINQFGDNITERWNKYVELLPKYIEIAGVRKSSSMWDYKYWDNGSWWTKNHRYILKNGMEFVFGGGGSCIQNMALNQRGCSEYDTTCSHSEPNSLYGTYQHGCHTIYVDLDGYDKGPNAFYKDVFVFIVVKDGIVPAGSPKETIWLNQFENSHTYTAWVLYNKNMDYLRCKDKLGWNKAKSCKG